MIGFLSFLSKFNYTTLPRLLFFSSFQGLFIHICTRVNKVVLCVVTFSATCRSFGRLLHSLHPWYLNARCLDDKRHRGMWRRLHDLVTLLWIQERGTNVLARYSGTKSFTHLNTITASWKKSLSFTVSQLRDFMPWEMWSNFLRPNTIRAAKFCTSRSFFILLWQVLAHTFY